MNDTSPLNFYVGLLFEGMVGFWAGWRGYHMAASMQAKDVMEDVTNIPLSQGRSIVSDEICSEVNDLVINEIPKEFWRNLDQEGNLQNEIAWRNIIRFSENCIKRKAFEKKIRTETGVADEEPVVIPPPGIPKNYLKENKDDNN